jgi:hypothetical protein
MDAVFGNSRGVITKDGFMAKFKRLGREMKEKIEK